MEDESDMIVKGINRRISVLKQVEMKENESREANDMNHQEVDCRDRLVRIE